MNANVRKNKQFPVYYQFFGNLHPEGLIRLVCTVAHLPAQTQWPIVLLVFFLRFVCGKQFFLYFSGDLLVFGEGH